MTATTATAAPTSTATASSTWKLDTVHSEAEFKVKHMMISYVRGIFSGLSGVLKLDEADYTRSSVEVAIPADNARTVDETLNAHLKQEDFFNVEKYPTITFQSTKIESKGGRNYAVTGDLTIRGVTKSVTLAVNDVSEPATDPWGNHRIGLSGSVKINRKDFGITWNTALELGGVLVGEEVSISLDVQFIKG